MGFSHEGGTMSSRTTFLSRLIGYYSVLVALAMIAHKQTTMGMISRLTTHAGTPFAIGLIAVAIGLAMLPGAQRVVGRRAAGGGDADWLVERDQGPALPVSACRGDFRAAERATLQSLLLCVTGDLASCGPLPDLRERFWRREPIAGEIATRSAGESLKKQAYGGDAGGTGVEADVCVGAGDASEGEDGDGRGGQTGGAEQVEAGACGDFFGDMGLLRRAIFGVTIQVERLLSNYIFGGDFFEDGAEEDEGGALLWG